MKKTYRTLDALRGIAALAVVIFHAKRLLGWDAIPSGYLAVDFFFALSGFVIGHAYDPRMKNQLSTGQFVWLRIARFYPLYFAGFAAGLFYELGLIGLGNPAAISMPTLIAASFAALAFLPFPFAQRGQNLFAFNVPSWSLFYELAVNAAYAVTFPYLSARVLPLIMAVSGVIFATQIVISGNADFGALAGDFLVAVPRTIFSFSTGLFIYRVNIRLPKVPYILIFILLIGPMLYPSGPLIALVFIFLISPLIVALAANVEPVNKAAKTFEYLGLISFPIYALHRPALAFAQTVSQRLNISPILALTTVMVCLIVASPGLERFYDKPARKFLNSLGKRHAAIPSTRPQPVE